MILRLTLPVRLVGAVYLFFLVLTIFLVCAADCMVPYYLFTALIGVIAPVLAKSSGDRVAGFAMCVLSLLFTYGFWSRSQEDWRSRREGLLEQIDRNRVVAPNTDTQEAKD